MEQDANFYYNFFRKEDLNFIKKGPKIDTMQTARHIVELYQPSPILIIGVYPVSSPKNFFYNLPRN
jgi:hypothetical protein